MSNRQEFRKLYTVCGIASGVMLLINFYYFAHPFFRFIHFTHSVVDTQFAMYHQSGMLQSPFGSKIWALAFVIAATIIREGTGTEDSYKKIFTIIGVGAAIFLFPLHLLHIPLPAVPMSLLYIVISLIGYILCAYGFADLGRKMSKFKKAENDMNETFLQCEEKIETPYSVNIPTKYQYQKKIHHGWINMVNPFRGSAVYGLPGSGKSFSVYNPCIEQMISKGYAMYCYDFKYPDLTEVVYNELLENYDNYDVKPEFCVINFKDPRYSYRCNPIHSRYIVDPADTTEIAELVMLNINKSAVEKEDFFSMSAKVYLDALVWFLKIYRDPVTGEQGKYCTFPHVIELMGQDYKDVFNIMTLYPELETKIKPFQSALDAGAQDQLQGQIASAQIPLNKFVSPALYWVLSGDDFSLDINDPKHPKLLCVGNDPDRQTIYGTTLALFTSRMFKLINHKHKRHCAVLLDELPTIFLKGLDNLIATARSNKVAIILGAQDKSQLIRDYTEKEANVIFNTVGNIFSGAVAGKTAEEFSKSFGREWRAQQSQTQSIDSESIQNSFQQQEILPQSKIETLTQGYFFGRVADNNDTPIDKKLFCGEIQIDMKKFAEKRKRQKPLPKMTDFGETEIEMEIRNNASDYLQEAARKEILKEINEIDPEALDIRAASLAESFPKTKKEEIIKAEVEKQVKAKVDELVQANFRQIRQDVITIIENELQRVYEKQNAEGGGEDVDDDKEKLDPLEALLKNGTIS